MDTFAPTCAERNKTMNFFESEDVSPMVKLGEPRFPLEDADLVIAPQSDTRGDGQNYYTVSELVVVAAPIGGSYSQDIVNLYPEGPSDEYTEFSLGIVDDAVAAAQNAYTLSQTPMAAQVTAMAQTALQRLFLASKSTQSAVDGPLTDTLNMSELESLRLVIINVGQHGFAEPAITFPAADGSANIFIDPNRLGNYISNFGLEKAVNYVVYHEIAHALTDARGQDGMLDSFKEMYANEYGQVLAELTGALYPNDTQLNYVGGTVGR